MTLPLSSCVFEFTAYNDTNGNGRLDYDDRSAEGHVDPRQHLWDKTVHAGGIFFVRDADTLNHFTKFNFGPGWNYSTGTEFPPVIEQDFERDFTLVPYGKK